MTVVFFVFFYRCAGGTGAWGVNGFQWLGGSGVNRKRGSRRFEWYQLQRGSGSIGGDMVGSARLWKKFWEN